MQLLRYNTLYIKLSEVSVGYLTRIWIFKVLYQSIKSSEKKSGTSRNIDMEDLV